MKKIISLLLVIMFLFIFNSCGEQFNTPPIGYNDRLNGEKFNKTSTGYKDNIKWGMSVEEVAEQLGDLIIKKTGTYIFAEDDENQGIGILASVVGGGDATYNFNNDGKLYEIKFEIESKWITFKDFENMVDIYKLDYEELEAGEIKRNDIGDSGAYVEYNTAYYDIDEYTELSIMIIKYNGISEDKGILTVSYRQKELYTEVLLSD